METHSSDDNYIEIIDGSELNKTIQDKHLGKKFRDILSETVKIPKNTGADLDLILDEKNKYELKPIGNLDLLKVINQNESTSVQIIKLSNIIMRMAVKYTQDIFMKKKKKEVLFEIRELINEIKQVKKILYDLENNT